VRDKERANFCDWFSPADSAARKAGAAPEAKARDARSDFDKLFG
jgi:hypothetical protein